jgi:two-component system CheB/CheR fusion protein
VEPQATSRRVLIVDDHPDTARSYYELLTLMGHSCEFRTDARQALDAARELKPQIALLDIGLLPDLDGHQLARMLRNEFGEKICLIAITAYGREEDRARTRKAGFDAHVTKPIDARLLESIIATARA